MSKQLLFDEVYENFSDNYANNNYDFSLSFVEFLRKYGENQHNAEVWMAYHQGEAAAFDTLKEQDYLD